MASDEIQYHEADGIAEITINRPHKRNAMTAAMFDELRACWERFDRGDARVAILKASDDKVFSAGADLTDPPEMFWHGIPELGFRTDKPTIAAVSGKAIGAGMVLALMCDFVVLSETAELIYPEARVGIAKGAASVLVKRAPMRLVLEMLLTGDPMPAQRAYETGMVNKMVPMGTHVIEARRMARQLADNAPLVVQMLKRVTLETMGDAPMQTLFNLNLKVDKVVNSQDAADALEAFKNKQKPTFNGR